jgi:hypothetical protein
MSAQIFHKIKQIPILNKRIEPLRAVLLSTKSSPLNESNKPHNAVSSPLNQFGGVHGTRSGAGSGTSKMWRNKPLLRREGDKIFKTGTNTY